MLLKSLQDLVPDELVNAELSSLDAFCLDSTLLPSASHTVSPAAATFPGIPRLQPHPCVHCSKMYMDPLHSVNIEYIRCTSLDILSLGESQTFTRSQTEPQLMQVLQPQPCFSKMGPPQLPILADLTVSFSCTAPHIPQAACHGSKALCCLPTPVCAVHLPQLA